MCTQLTLAEFHNVRMRTGQRFSVNAIHLHKMVLISNDRSIGATADGFVGPPNVWGTSPYMARVEDTWRGKN